MFGGFVLIFMLSFDRVSDRGVARPLGFEEDTGRNILRPLELGLSFSTDWIRETLLDSTDSQLYLLPALHAGRAVDLAVLNLAPAPRLWAASLSLSSPVSSTAVSTSTLDGARDRHSSPRLCILVGGPGQTNSALRAPSS